MPGRRHNDKWVVGLSLHPASTSCRPPCGLLIMADTCYRDGRRGPQLSLGCQCKTGPLLLLDLLRVNELSVLPRSHSFGPSSCSVSDDSGRACARF